MTPEIARMLPLRGLSQISYATTDIGRAIAELRKTYGFKDVLEMRGLTFPTGAGRSLHCNAVVTYVGATEIEIIQPLDGDTWFWRDRLAMSGSHLVFHHVSRIFDTEYEFRARYKELTEQGIAIPVEGIEGDLYWNYFADFTDVLGHYVEHGYYTPAGRAFVANIPKI